MIVSDVPLKVEGAALRSIPWRIRAWSIFDVGHVKLRRADQLRQEGLGESRYCFKQNNLFRLSMISHTHTKDLTASFSTMVESGKKENVF